MPDNGPPKIGERVLAVVPDSLDFRDFMFVPTLVEVPETRPLDDYLERMGGGLEILDQGSEGACTGFALAAVAHYLLWTGGRRRAGEDGRTWIPDAVSPWMLYTVAKRYDEWPGEDYDGSSARGAMKGWHRHGICSLHLWPDGRGNGGPDEWAERWNEARRRPLGAYFRVNHRDLVALHSAVTEVGVLYATALVHEGWSAEAVAEGVIEYGPRKMGGHAFAIVGYDADGFWIQNSWGPDWGRGGFAHLSYDDWLANGMDVWVARLGAPIRIAQHESTATGLSASSQATRGYVFCDLRPHVISIGNDGLPRTSGTFGTDAEDIRRIFRSDVPAFIESYGREDRPLHLLLYAHGGLVPEEAAVQRLADLRAPLLENGIFPISFVWRSDFWTTLGNILRDALKRRQSEGILDEAKDFMLDRLDDAVEPLARGIGGKAQWDEMKENALLATIARRGAARVAAAALEEHLGDRIRDGSLRLHVVGHSAGSVFHAPLVRLLGSRGELDFNDLRGRRTPAAEGLGLPITTCVLWAPACTVALFEAAYAPLIRSGAIEDFALFTLTDTAELDDHCNRVYNKSLLYLVSHAFEETPRIPVLRPAGVPILGMERYAASALDGLERAVLVRSPNTAFPEGPNGARARSHGSFDDDPAVLKATLARMLAAAAGRKAAREARFDFGRTDASKRERRQELERQVPRY